MKKTFLFISAILAISIFVLSACKSNSPADPCNNMGTLCIENKMDSTITVSIVQKHEQVPVEKDFIYCFDLEANQPYTVSVSGSGYKKPDTTLMILPCDNKTIIISQ
jgi:hypothetical protein